MYGLQLVVDPESTIQVPKGGGGLIWQSLFPVLHLLGFNNEADAQ